MNGNQMGYGSVGRQVHVALVMEVLPQFRPGRRIARLETKEGLPGVVMHSVPTLHFAPARIVQRQHIPIISGGGDEVRTSRR